MRAVRATFDRFFGERGTHLAAMVAYFALASFVPLIFLALSILGFLDQADSSSALVTYLEDIFPNQSVESIVRVVGSSAATVLSIRGTIRSGRRRRRIGSATCRTPSPRRQRDC